MPLSAPALTADSEQQVELLAHAARAASGAGSGVTIRARFSWITFELLVTAVSGSAGDNLDVYIQHQLDGANWEDIAHYQTVNGAGSPQAQCASFHVGRI